MEFVEYKNVDPEPLTVSPISELIDEKFTIVGFRSVPSKKWGTMGIFKVDGRGDYYTYSSVLLKQGKKIDQAMQIGQKGVVVTLRMRKNYYTFE